MTAVLVFAAAFYARKNYRIPTLVSVLTVGLNVGLNALFVFGLGMGAISVAVATTLTACMNGALLAAFLHKEGTLDFKGLGGTLLKVLLCSCLAGFVTIQLGHVLFEEQTWSVLMGQPVAPFARHFSSQLLIFGSEALFYSSSLFFFAFILRVRELLDLLPFPFRRKERV